MHEPRSRAEVPRIPRREAGRQRRAGTGPLRGAPAGAVLVLLALGGGAGATAAQELPDGVTRAMVEQGRQLFVSDGFCYTCHGRDGSGLEGAGGDLTDGDWRHTDGSFEGLVRRIDEGVRANVSSSGVPMPPAGGANLNPEQLRAVAAYVWTLGPSGR